MSNMNIPPDGSFNFRKFLAEGRRLSKIIQDTPLPSNPLADTPTIVGSEQVPQTEGHLTPEQVEAVSINNRASVLIALGNIGSPNVQKLSPEEEKAAIEALEKERKAFNALGNIGSEQVPQTEGHLTPEQVEAVSINNRASVLITPRDIGIESPNQKLSPEREEEAIKTISEILKKAGIL